MIATDFKEGCIYTGTFKYGRYFAGKLYKKGESITFLVVEKPCNKFNGGWLKATVKNYKYAWAHLYLDDLENITQKVIGRPLFFDVYEGFGS